ncbi:MAG: hypothetical protein ACYDA4_15295 [Ignavibacteriaceae bacterium]
MEFLNFQEISQKVQFKDVLDWLNIPYSVYQNGEIRGEGFIVNPAKNLYLDPQGDDKGSVINFLAKVKSVDLRSAAKELKDHFLNEAKLPKRELPNLELHYCPFLKEKGISEEMAKDYEIGLVKQHSIISGRIAFKIYDENKNHTGYVAYNHGKDEWFFPKGFKRELYNIHRIDAKEVVLTVSIFECLDYIKKGIPSVSLIGKTMTDKQVGQLVRFVNILVVHPEPDNIVVRLSKNSFVKSTRPDEPIKYL